MKRILGVLIIIVLLVGCKEKNNTNNDSKETKESIQIKYAKGFDIQYFKY